MKNKLTQNEFVKAMASMQEIIANMTDDEAVKAIADIVVEGAQIEAESVDMTSYMTRMKRVNPGDEFKIRAPKGATIYVHAPGTPAQPSKLSADFTSLPHNRHSYFIELDINELRGGRFDELVEDMGTIRNFFKMSRNAIMFSLYTNGATGLGGLSAANDTELEARLKTAINYAMDKPGTRTMIIGRSSVLTKISDFTNFSPNMQDEVNRTGILGTWRGAEVIPFQDFVDADGVSYIGDKDIVVFRKEAGRGARYRNLQKAVAPVIALPGYQIHVYEELGMGLIYPDRAVNIHLTY